MLNLKQSYSKCIQIFKENYKKEFIGLYIFNYDKFKHICAFYSFIKILNNIVNSQATLLKKKTLLFDLETLFFTMLNDYQRNPKNAVFLTTFIKKEYEVFFEIFPALNHTNKKYDIGKHNLQSIFTSMRMDLDKNQYQNFSELEQYLSGTGEVFSEFLYLLMENEDNSFDILDYIYSLGNGFQFSNILLNIKNDFNKKPLKIYIPLDEQKEYDCNLELEIPRIINNSISNNSINLVKYQINRCKKYYEYSQQGVDRIDKEYNEIVNGYVKIYSNFNEKIIQNNYDIINTKLQFNYIDLYRELSWKSIFSLVLNYLYFNFIGSIKLKIFYMFNKIKNILIIPNY